MYAIIKKAVSELSNKFPLPSRDEPVELTAKDDSIWSLVEWNKELIGADALNEIIKNAPDSVVFDGTDDTSIDGKLIEGVNSFISKNFKEKA